MKGAGMLQAMRSDALSGQRQHLLSGCGDMECQTMIEAVSAHRPTPGVAKEMPVDTVRADRKPIAQDGSCFSPQRQFALAATLACDAHRIEVRSNQLLRNEHSENWLAT